MTERPSLFREEALEFHARATGPGAALRIDARWAKWLYWIALTLVVAGAVTGVTVRTSETTSGPALISAQQRTFVALVPAAASSDLKRGQLLRLQLDGPAGRPLAGRMVRFEVADQAAVHDAGFASSSQASLLVTGVIAPDADLGPLPASPRHDGRVVVVLRSERILTLFLHQLGGMFRAGGGA